MLFTFRCQASLHDDAAFFSEFNPAPPASAPLQAALNERRNRATTMRRCFSQTNERQGTSLRFSAAV
jgi:hypothetical protein